MSVPSRNPPVVNYPPRQPLPSEQPERFWRPAFWAVLIFSIVSLVAVVAIGVALNAFTYWHYWATQVDNGEYTIVQTDSLWGVFPGVAIMLLLNFLAAFGCRQAARGPDRTLLVLYCLMQGIAVSAEIAMILVLYDTGAFGVTTVNGVAKLIVSAKRTRVGLAGVILLATPLWIIVGRYIRETWLHQARRHRQRRR